MKNVHEVRSYIQKNNVPCEWRDVSGCRSFWTDEVMKEAEKEIAHLRTIAPELADHITIIRDKAELNKHRVASDAIGATLSAGAASLWPYKLVAYTLEHLIKSNHLNLQTHTPVTSLTSTPTAHTLHTPRGTITAKTVILATNAYTSHLLPHFADLIVPVRGEMSALLPPAGSTILPDSHGMVAALGQPANNDDYLVQRPFSGVPNPRGHLMFGGGRGAGEHTSMGVCDDSVIDAGSAAYLRRALLSVLALDGDTAGLHELEAVAQWTGIMGYSRDNHPWVGAVPGARGLWLAGGYTGHGMPNTTLCGKAVVDMVLGCEADGSEGVEALGALQDKMVREGDIPRSYLITEERIERARRLQTVEVQDRAGVHMNGVV
jgi:glycine/D-amino acid oxidase-like deaminating enzyme